MLKHHHLLKTGEKMNKRQYKDSDKYISLLGMGGMRFPTLENREIDVENAELLIDYAIKNGVNYFDTAYFYHDEKSEEFLGKTLSRYPRDSYFLTDKMPMWMAETSDDAYRMFEEQFKRCGVDYFDFYFCHALCESEFKKHKEFGFIDFLFEKKKEGIVKNVGFSFHDTPEMLEEILKSYQWDVCQLQLNFFDWEYQRAREQYEVCKKYGVQVIVMEPVRGGALADLGEKANACLKTVNPDKSIASWAIRFAMEKENVLTVLSGMSNVEQVKDNVETASGDVTLSETETEALNKALAEYKKSKLIPCTACNYCKGCPVGIDIRHMFKIYNDDAYSSSKTKFKEEYKKLENKADKCIGCGKCIRKCPQGIDIPSELKKISEI